MAPAPCRDTVHTVFAMALPPCGSDTFIISPHGKEQLHTTIKTSYSPSKFKTAFTLHDVIAAFFIFPVFLGPVLFICPHSTQDKDTHNRYLHANSHHHPANSLRHERLSTEVTLQHETKNTDPTITIISKFFTANFVQQTILGSS